MNQAIPYTDSALPSSYSYIRGFASRLCLVLERYFVITDYEMQAPEALDEAIQFFKVAAGQSVGDELIVSFDPKIISHEFVGKVLNRMPAIPQRERETSSRVFCEFAIGILMNLRKAPKRVSKGEILTVHDFFCTTEIVVDQSMLSMQEPVFSVPIYL